MEESVIDFSKEAEQCLKEVSYAVTEGALSSVLPSNETCAFLNLTTKEGQKFTVRLSLRGFEVVGNDHDAQNLDDGSSIVAYETVYSLLEYISPSYQLNFQSAVASKLRDLEKKDDVEKQE